MHPLTHRLRVRLSGARSDGDASLLPDLESNLSFVLHEHSASDAVRRTALAARRHAARTRSAPRVADRSVVCDGDPFQTELWLTVTLGLPVELPHALITSAKSCSSVVPIDGDEGPMTQHVFFRSPAMLTLAGEPRASVGVAALVARPGEDRSQLVLRGPYVLPDELQAALRQLESLIQSYADQWIPERMLWNAPAEALLHSEVR